MERETKPGTANATRSCLVSLFYMAKELAQKYLMRIKRLVYGKLYCTLNESRARVDPRQVMFFTFQGEYTCNCKYISEEMQRADRPWKQVWVTFERVERVADRFPDCVELVRFNSLAYYKALITSGFLVDNAFNFVKGYIHKRPEQVFIETMHGSLGIKRIGGDAVRSDGRNRRGALCGELTDYVLSNSSFETMVYETAFWRRENIVETGHARNDVFFRGDALNAPIVAKVRGYFKLGESTSIALYAPTVRNADEKNDAEAIDFKRLWEALRHRFGGEWVILYRLHHSMEHTDDDVSYPFVLDADQYSDIQELMLAADVGITDYSSWIFDYVLRCKPGFLFMPDLDHYNQHRGFYYPLSEAPFPIARSNDELEGCIQSFDDAAFGGRVREFLDRRGCIDDGRASERIVKLMEDIVRERERL